MLVHNFRPGVPERLGIDYERLSRLNPRLIYCAVTGYGETGPLKDKAGYDQVLQAMSGMCVLQGKPDGAPEIVLRLDGRLLRGRAGRGRRRVRAVRARAQRAGTVRRRVAAAKRADDAVRAHDLGGRRGARHLARHALRAASPACIRRARVICISPRTRRISGRRCARRPASPSLANDPRYDTVRKRAQHAAEIVPKLREALHARTALEWEQLFGDQVPCAMARRIEDMFDHPQVLAEEIVDEDRASDAGQLPRCRAADQVRTHARAGAVRRAGAGTGLRCR